MFCSSGYESEAPKAFQGIATDGRVLVAYESLNPLQKRLIKDRDGTATSNGIIFNLSVSIGKAFSTAIPICDPHPEKVLNFVQYLIIIDPEKVRDFWVNASTAQIVKELKSNVAKYFQINGSRVDLKSALIDEPKPAGRKSARKPRTRKSTRARK